MNKNKYIIESLSMDLMRVAIGYHRGSIKSAEKFSEEALLRKKEINISIVKPYFANILNKLPDELSNKNRIIVAENALMYSVICKNYSAKFA